MILVLALCCLVARVLLLAAGVESALLPSPALALSAWAASRARRGGDLGVALATGAAEGLLIDDAWGALPLACLATVGILGTWRGGGRDPGGLVRVARSLIALAVVAVAETALRALLDDAAPLSALSGGLGRALGTAALVPLCGALLDRRSATTRL